ncbi:MAG: glycosyltransferase, partial [Pseudomonadota bacterium]
VIACDKGAPNFSSNRHQATIINGLAMQADISLEIISGPITSSYPKYSKLFVRLGKRSITNKIKINYCSIVNIKLLKFIIFAICMFWKIVKWANSSLDVKEKVIFIYSPFTHQMLAAVLSKIFFKSSLVLMVPDIPEDVYSNQTLSGWKMSLIKLSFKLNDFLYRKINGFIFLTQAMKDCLPLNNRPYLVIEGAVNASGLQTRENRTKYYERPIMYAGMLMKLYGIEELLRAFERIKNPEARLWLCGRGDAEDAIKEAAIRDKRLIYFGAITPEKVNELERSAWALINPRKPVGEYVKYSFPSKTMEYLLSGRPVLMYRLPGVPEEYYEYLTEISASSSDGLEEALKNILDLTESEAECIGNKGREFVLINKNEIVQAKKMIDFMHRLTVDRLNLTVHC